MEITSKQQGWHIETSDGLVCIPASVVPIPEWLRIGAEVSNYERQVEEVYEILANLLHDHCTGEIQTIEALPEHYWGICYDKVSGALSPWQYDADEDNLRRNLAEGYGE
jgi:hypothetical protein